MSSRRDHLVDTAMKLFCKHGFRATGIDTVLAESGVAKKTLYNHFRSKDELIIATLQRRDTDFMNLAREGVARLADKQDGDPRMARVLALFDTLGEWAAGDNFTGCTFINLFNTLLLCLTFLLCYSSPSFDLCDASCYP